MGVSGKLVWVDARRLLVGLWILLWCYCVIYACLDLAFALRVFGYLDVVMLYCVLWWLSLVCLLVCIVFCLFCLFMVVIVGCLFVCLFWWLFLLCLCLSCCVLFVLCCFEHFVIEVGLYGVILVICIFWLFWCILLDFGYVLMYFNRFCVILVGLLGIYLYLVF